MATFNYELAEPPSTEHGRVQWLQHAAGFLLFQDVREYAQQRIDPSLSPEARDAAGKAIDDAVYGLMMVLDGVSGSIRNSTMQVNLRVASQLVKRGVATGGEVMAELDLLDGDGMCMGYHQWREGRFGDDPIAIFRPSDAAHAG